MNDHGHVDSKRLCGLEVEHELEFGGLHHRQVGGLLAFTADLDSRGALKPFYPLDLVNLSATGSLDLYRFTLVLADQRACNR